VCCDNLRVDSSRPCYTLGAQHDARARNKADLLRPLLFKRAASVLQDICAASGAATAAPMRILRSGAVQLPFKGNTVGGVSFVGIDVVLHAAMSVWETHLAALSETFVD